MHDDLEFRAHVLLVCSVTKKAKLKEVSKWFSTFCAAEMWGKTYVKELEKEKKLPNGKKCSGYKPEVRYETRRRHVY
ncbi:hypothetical protein KTR10_03105 [Candidatus Kaiserbacteria bacterium]|nr:hypothetical protein [Candidatus Kaiserbacteria bacterium]